MLARLLSLVRLTLMAAGALLLTVTFTPIVPWTALRLSSNWTDADGDVLIVLGGSTITYPGFPSGRIIGESTYWRALSAVYVWRTGHFRNLLLCGADTEQTVKPLLIAYGIPEQAILVENRSTSTHENALFAKPILASRSGRFVLLTSDYHMFRAARCFARAGISVYSRPFPDVIKRSDSLMFRWQGFGLLSSELVRIAYYGLRGWI
jgi:uncharacterized SAM-binding protein YcdF (DUF218 family)